MRFRKTSSLSKSRDIHRPVLECVNFLPRSDVSFFQKVGGVWRIYGLCSSLLYSEVGYCFFIMTSVKSLKGNIIDGWSRNETSLGVPFYKNSSTKCSQWDHPEIVRILQELDGYNGIRYCAYRTAVKLRHVQKMLKLHWMKLSLVYNACEDYGYSSCQNHVILDYVELQKFLFYLYTKAEGELPIPEQAALHSELLLNLLQNMFDMKREKGIELSAVKVVLSILCACSLLEKYKYIFREFVGSNGFLKKKTLHSILYSIAKVPEILGEKINFGTHLVPASVESCMEWNNGGVWISEANFLEWMKQEPQTLVWISTHFRMCTAEKVEHYIKCDACKIYPMIGLRYQCTHCFNYNICQNCFFYCRVSKNHKLKHALQEYCKPVSSWESIKMSLKSIQSKLALSHDYKCNYLMIDHHLAIARKRNNSSSVATKVSKIMQTDSELVDEWISSKDEMKLQFVASPNYWNELESIILRLENENKNLIKEIERLHTLSDNDSSGGSFCSQDSANSRKEQLLAKQELLEDHSHQLEVQVLKLRRLLQKLCKDGSCFQNTEKLSTPANAKQSVVTKFESTPANLQSKQGHLTNLSTFIKLRTGLELLDSVTEDLKCSVKDIPDMETRNKHILDNPDKINDSSTSTGGSCPSCQEFDQTDSQTVENKTTCIESVGQSVSSSQYTFGDLTVAQSVVPQSTISTPFIPVNQEGSSEMEIELAEIIGQLENILGNKSISEVAETTGDFKAKIVHALHKVEAAMGEFPNTEDTQM